MSVSSGTGQPMTGILFTDAHPTGEIMPANDGFSVDLRLRSGQIFLLTIEDCSIDELLSSSPEGVFWLDEQEYNLSILSLTLRTEIAHKVIDCWVGESMFVLGSVRRIPVGLAFKMQLRDGYLLELAYQSNDLGGLISGEAKFVMPELDLHQARSLAKTEITALTREVLQNLVHWGDPQVADDDIVIILRYRAWSEIARISAQGIMNLKNGGSVAVAIAKYYLSSNQLPIRLIPEILSLIVDHELYFKHDRSCGKGYPVVEYTNEGLLCLREAQTGQRWTLLIGKDGLLEMTEIHGIPALCPQGRLQVLKILNLGQIQEAVASARPSAGLGSKWRPKSTRPRRSAP